MNNERFKHLLILALVSLGIAVACYFLGGIVAEASGKPPDIGVQFKAGGSLAGFVISFIMLLTAYRLMGGSAFICKVTVAPNGKVFNRTGSNFTAKVTVLKRKSNRRIESDAIVIWEAGGLTVHLRDVEEDDMVMIVISDGNSGRWESNFFSPLCQSLTLN